MDDQQRLIMAGSGGEWLAWFIMVRGDGVGVRGDDNAMSQRRTNHGNFNAPVR